MNKKATGIFIATFTVLSIALFIYMYVVLVYNSSTGRYSRLTGEVASDILERQDLANMQFLSTGKAADYAAYKALVSLGENGGLCQDWSKKECIPEKEKINDKFIDYFKDHFQKYTQTIPANYKVWLMRLSVTNKFILFLNSDEVHILKPGLPTSFYTNNVVVDYITKHKFNREISYDLDFYNELYNKYHESRKSCEDYGIKSEEITKRNLIFIPVNWGTDEATFKKKAEASFNYFVQLAKLNGDKTQYVPLYYFSKLQLTCINCAEAAEKVENHVTSWGISFDKNKDRIIGFAEKLDILVRPFDVPGFVPALYPYVAFVETEPSILVHELGHSLFGYCDEYEYADIKCPDSIEHKNLVEKIIYDNMESYINIFLDATEEKIFDEEVISRIQELKLPDEYINKYAEEEKDKMFDNLKNSAMECIYFDGWLPQHYKEKYNFKNLNAKFDGCQNPYPTCCIDSPNYGGDAFAGINCYPDDFDVECWRQKIINEIELDTDITEQEKQQMIEKAKTMPRKELLERFACAGASCGENCRSIMGPVDLCAPITSRMYPTKEKLTNDLKDNVKCDDLSDEIYIKFEATTEDLLFTKPIIKFKVGKLKPL